MNKLWIYACLGICACLGLAMPAASSSPQAIRLGAENSWPPYTDERGLGLSTNLVKAAFQHQGIEPSFYVQPYARVLHDLRSGKIDGGYNVTLQKSTRNKFVFGKVPLLTLSSHWYFLPGAHTHIQSLEAIPDNFRVGVILDYEYGDAYENHRHRFNEVRVAQQTQLIRLLKQGRVDAILMFEQEALYTLQHMTLKQETLDKRFLNHSGGVYVAFSRKNPHARWFAQQLDQGLIALQESGEYAQILANAGERD